MNDNKKVVSPNSFNKKKEIEIVSVSHDNPNLKKINADNKQKS